MFANHDPFTQASTTCYRTAPADRLSPPLRVAISDEPEHAPMQRKRVEPVLIVAGLVYVGLALAGLWVALHAGPGTLEWPTFVT